MYNHWTDIRRPFHILVLLFIAIVLTVIVIFRGLDPLINQRLYIVLPSALGILFDVGANILGGGSEVDQFGEAAKGLTETWDVVRQVLGRLDVS